MKFVCTVSLAICALALGCSGAEAARDGGNGPSTASGGGVAIGGNSAGGTPSVGLGGMSSQGGSGGGIGLPSAGSAGEANCGFQYFEIQSKPAEVLLVLDRSASMEDPPDGATDEATSKWQLVVPAVNQVISATNGAVSWGMKTYPEGEGSECIVGSVTNRIDVPLAAMNASAVTAAVTSTTPKGNGTPTAAAVNEAVKYLQARTSDNPKYILLATDGEPSCPKPSDAARTQAVEAVAAAATAGFPTFVVGVATTKESATTVLNQMATAGTRPRDDANPRATRYYLANTQDELVSALQVITGQVASCIFPFSAVPPAPDKIAVKVGGNLVPRDPNRSEGWDYTGADNRGVEVYGSWCEQIKKSATNTVDIVFGCPNEPPPR